MFTRDCVPMGRDIVLRAFFLDDCGIPLQLAEVNMEITSSNGVSAASFSLSGGTISNPADGMYEVTYTVPLDPVTFEIGSWTDDWVGYISFPNISVSESFSFQVVNTGKAVQQIIANNTLIVVVLDSAIADINGNTLGEEIQLSFSSEYDPYYCSPDLIRLEVGHWIDAVPDDTISLMIHWSSKEVDEIAYSVRNQSMFNLAKTKFVIYDVACRMLTLPIDINGTQKRLSELLIRRDGNFKNVMEELKKNRNEWYRVVNAGGTIVPGQSFAPSVAVKGYTDPDRGSIGRGWHHPGQFPYRQYAGNAAIKMPGQRKYKKGFLDLPSWYIKGDLDE